MSNLSAAIIVCLCVSSSFATFGADYKHQAHSKHHYEAHSKPHYEAHSKHHYEPHRNHHYDAPKVHKGNEGGFHLDSPKIILNRPSINVHESAPLHEDEPIILANEKPLYIRKSLHGVPAGQVINAAHPAPVPVLLDGGYSHGKVLDITAPIQVINHAPIVHERPILIRRPVVVSKSLSGTQEHLENIHYAHSGLAHSGGYSHGEFAVPVSKALHERTVVYGGLNQGYGGLAHGYGGHGYGYAPLAHGYGGLGHGYGGLNHGYGGLAHGYGGLAHGYGGLAHGYGTHIAPAIYSAPLVAEQPKAVVIDQPKSYGHSHGGFVPITPVHAHGGHLHASHEKKY